MHASMLVVAVIALCALLEITLGDPVEHSRRQGVWPRGKWQELTQTHLHQNHEVSQHLIEQLGHAYPTLRLGHATTMWEYQHKMILFGGATAGGPNVDVRPLNDLWQFDIDKIEWRELLPETSRPDGRVYHTMFQFNHWTYVFGGATFAGPEWELWSSNSSTTYFGDLWVWDPTTGVQGAWRDIGRGMSGMPSPRHSMSVAYLNGNFFIFGGKTASGPANDLYMFTPDENDITAGTWVVRSTTSAVHPLARAAHSAAVLDDGEMYVFGGQHNDTLFLGDLWRYDPYKDDWFELPSVGCKANPVGPRGIWPHPVTSYWDCGDSDTHRPSARSGHQASPSLLSYQTRTLPYGSMVVFGGRTASHDFSNQVWVYARGSNSWMQHSELCVAPINHADIDQRGRKTQCIEPGDYEDRIRPSPRWRHSIAAYHNRTEISAYHGTQLYMFGGAAGTYGGWDFMDVPGTAAHGMKDLWIYHV